jgi:hypothetical protein
MSIESLTGGGPQVPAPPVPHRKCLAVQATDL